MQRTITISSVSYLGGASYAAGREAEITFNRAPTPGAQTHLVVPPEAIEDEFGNHPAQGIDQNFLWPQPGETLVLFDTAPRTVEEIYLLDGKLVVGTSEPITPTEAASAFLIDDAAVTWQQGYTPYHVELAGLTPGEHTITTVTAALATRTGDPATENGDGNENTLAERNATQPFNFTPAEPFRWVLEITNPRALALSAAGNPYGFHGRPADPDSGLVYFRHRWYDPEIGRFISADPMGYVDGPNDVQAFLNDPVNTASRFGCGTLGPSQSSPNEPCCDGRLPQWAGPGLVTLYDTTRRSQYLEQIQDVSRYAVQRVQDARAANDLGAAEEAAKSASRLRNSIRAATQRRLSPGGYIVSRAIDEPRDWSYISRRYAKANPFDTYEAIAAASGRSRPELRALQRFGRFLGPVATLAGTAVATKAIVQAEPSERTRVIAQEAGGFVGGAIGANLGAAAGVSVVTGIAAVAGVSSGPPGWVVLVASLVGGGIGGYYGSDTGRNIGDDAYSHLMPVDSDLGWLEPGSKMGTQE